MRIAILFLLTVHALLHLLGFLKSWGLVALPDLSGRTLFPISTGGLSSDVTSSRSSSARVWSIDLTYGPRARNVGCPSRVIGTPWRRPQASQPALVRCAKAFFNPEAEIERSLRPALSFSRK